VDVICVAYCVGLPMLFSSAIVRLLYHRPSFAVLDEATSGLAADIISTVYDTFETRGIQVVTITQALGPAAVGYHARAVRLGECCPSGWQETALGTQAPRPALGLVEGGDAPADAQAEGQGRGQEQEQQMATVEDTDSGWDSDGEEPDGDTPLVAG